MAFGQIVELDTLRSLAFGSISGSYAPVGSALTHAARVICITNNTNGDMFFSDDGVNDKLFLAKSTFKLFDLGTNRDGGDNQAFKFPLGRTFYVRQSTSPSSGAVYIECLYSYGD